MAGTLGGSWVHRGFGIAIVLLWLTAVVGLFRRDVMPYWMAQQPPRGTTVADRLQSAIYFRDQRIGFSQVRSRRVGTLMQVDSRTRLDFSTVRITGLPPLPPVIFSTQLNFQDEESLIGFESHVFGMPFPIEVKGDLLGIDYSCYARIGDFRHTFSLDARASRQLTEAVRPFTYLPNLEVGQRWQIQALDPAPLLAGQAASFRPLLATVAAKDTIEHGGRQVECFRIEADRATAWADADGRVLVQIVDLPLIGKVTLRDEPFDDALSGSIFKMIRNETRGRDPSGRSPSR